jgi:hypothetical protein
MSFERPSAGVGPGAEPAPTPGPSEPSAAGEAGATPLALQLQVLSTEHWSLLASRSLAWNESFARAGMFLSALSGAIVALALVAQATAFGDGFRIFALVILPVVLFIGFTTLIRLGLANYHDALCVLGMNRIRAAYFDRVPEVRRYFVMPGHDDDSAVWRAMGQDPSMPVILALLGGAPILVIALNAVVAGVIGTVAGLQLEASAGGAFIVGAVVFLVVFVAELAWGRREALRERPEAKPMFPTPTE